MCLCVCGRALRGWVLGLPPLGLVLLAVLLLASSLRVPSFRRASFFQAGARPNVFELLRNDRNAGAISRGAGCCGAPSLRIFFVMFVVADSTPSSGYSHPFAVEVKA